MADSKLAAVAQPQVQDGAGALNNLSQHTPSLVSYFLHRICRNGTTLVNWQSLMYIYWF